MPTFSFNKVENKINKTYFPKHLFVLMILSLLLITISHFYFKNQNKNNKFQIASAPPTNTNPNTSIDESRRNAIVAASEKIEKSVVTVTSVLTRTFRVDPFFEPFFSFPDFGNVYQQKIPNLGSGFIASEDGIIVTNYHVVEGAEEVSVILTNGKEHKATLLGGDRSLDIAFLKINASDKLIPITFGDSSDLMIGEWAIAVGNPFGNFIKDPRPTVTVGVVSALHRAFSPDAGRVYQDMIQTDAAINPGNSGGPLVNAKGEVIGINTFIFTKSGGYDGVGFAIPINKAKRLLEEIKKYGKIREVWFGFKVQDINMRLANYFRLSDTKGALIISVQLNSPASKAGLKIADVITKVNNKEVNNSDDLVVSLAGAQVNDEFNFTIIREGEIKEIKYLVEEYRE